MEVNAGMPMPIRPGFAAMTVASLLVLLIGAFASGLVQPAQRASVSSATYEVVIRHGRVIDPESRLDAVLNIGVSDGVIRAIDSQPLIGRSVIDATGLVVAPGFIDIVWGMPREYAAVQLLDGVTTSLELWIGTDDVERWYAERDGKAVTNFGVAIGHERVRRSVMHDPGLPGSRGDAMNRAATDAELVEILRRIDRGLAEGALVVSMTNVTPGASGWETLQVFQAAGRAGAVLWSPPRETGNWHADDMPRYLTELIGAAAVAGSALGITHLQASGGPHIPRLLQILEEARAQGMDVVAEVIPYSSNVSHINVVDSIDWQNWPDAWFEDMEWMATGERLTRENYALYRERDGQVIIHNDQIEPLVTEAVMSPLTMVVSGAYLDELGHGHPRASGTHARLLGHYVRERRKLSMGDALCKMSLMVAQYLEGRTPAIANKGRIREAADADIVVFDEGRIIDRATFRNPTQASEGVRYVLVNGVLVVRDGLIQPDVFAGRPVRAPVPDWRGRK
jgi:dihydroorotase